jgi:hypothetical protein
MCGDRGYLTWDFGSFTACDIYANGLSHGEATPTLKLRPICQPGLSGFTAGALGFPPGTAVTGTLTDDSGTISANYVANRFGTLGSGPTSFVLGSQSQITVSLSSNLGTITKTLTSASCPT